MTNLQKLYQIQELIDQSMNCNILQEYIQTLITIEQEYV